METNVMSRAPLLHVSVDKDYLTVYLAVLAYPMGGYFTNNHF